MSVSLLLGLVYLISASGLQENLIRKSGTQEPRKGATVKSGHAAVVVNCYRFSAGDTPASTVAQLMHRKRLTMRERNNKSYLTSNSEIKLEA
jgi:hypothetical protein